jgi:hypothetical protein
MARSKKPKAQLGLITPILREIIKVRAELRLQREKAPLQQQKALDFKMKALKRCREDLFDFWEC